MANESMEKIIIKTKTIQKTKNKKQKGKIIRKQCHVCHGSGVEEGSSHFLIDLQPGTTDGYQYELDHEGDEHKDQLVYLFLFFTEVSKSGKYPSKNSLYGPLSNKNCDEYSSNV